MKLLPRRRKRLLVLHAFAMLVTGLSIAAFSVLPAYAARMTPMTTPTPTVTSTVPITPQLHQQSQSLLRSRSLL